MHSSFCFSHRLVHFLTSSSPLYIYLNHFTKEFAPDSLTNGFAVVITNNYCYVIKERKQATLAMHRTLFFKNLLHLTFPALCTERIEDDFLVNCTQPSFSQPSLMLHFYYHIQYFILALRMYHWSVLGATKV